MLLTVSPRWIWDKIRELRDQGSTIIVATSEVPEAEYLQLSRM